MRNIIVQLKLIKNASRKTSCDQSSLNSHICIRNRRSHPSVSSSWFHFSRLVINSCRGGIPAGSEPDWLPPGHLVNCFCAKEFFRETLSRTVAISIGEISHPIHEGKRTVIFVAVALITEGYFSLPWNLRNSSVDVVKIKSTWNLSAFLVGNIFIASQLT